MELPPIKVKDKGKIHSGTIVLVGTKAEVEQRLREIDRVGYSPSEDEAHARTKQPLTVLQIVVKVVKQGSKQRRSEGNLVKKTT